MPTITPKAYRRAPRAAQPPTGVHTPMSIWQRGNFPPRDLRLTPFPGVRRTMARPYTWTPTASFHFGGRAFIPLRPCIAFETRNFGWVAQQRPDGRVTLARE